MKQYLEKESSLLVYNRQFDEQILTFIVTLIWNDFGKESYFITANVTMETNNLTCPN